MDDLVTVIEIQDWRNYTITRILRDGTVLSVTRYTADTWPMIRIEDGQARWSETGSTRK